MINETVRNINPTKPAIDTMMAEKRTESPPLYRSLLLLSFIIMVCGFLSIPPPSRGMGSLCITRSGKVSSIILIDENIEPGTVIVVVITSNVFTINSPSTFDCFTLEGTSLN